MIAQDPRELLKAKPFEPVRLGIGDGRSVRIRHPEPVVVSDRRVYVGLANSSVAPLPLRRERAM